MGLGFLACRSVCDFVSVPIVVRMMYALFERDYFSPDSARGRRLLCGMLQVFADNKVIEDVHGKLRLAAKANANMVMNYSHMQDIANYSHVLDSREIPHRATVSKDTFDRKFRARSAKIKASDHESSRHRMSKSWSQVMGKKKWHTVNEDSLRHTAAAWEWLQNGCAGLPVDRILDGQLASLLHPGLLVERNGILMMSLGNYKWAALCWPLDRKDVDVYGMRYDPDAAAVWVHVRDVSEWRACCRFRCRSTVVV